MTSRFPDTAAGAKAALRILSTFQTTSKTTATPDPSHPGVWLLSDLRSEYGDRARAIVYLAGFEGRTEDDFESEEDV